MLEVTPQITRAQKKRQGARLVENDNYVEQDLWCGVESNEQYGEKKIDDPSSASGLCIRHQVAGHTLPILAMMIFRVRM